jgi:hypothetical protein
MQVKTRLRFHFTPGRVAIISTNNESGEDVGRKEPSYAAGGNVS